MCFVVVVVDCGVCWVFVVELVVWLVGIDV